MDDYDTPPVPFWMLDHDPHGRPIDQRFINAACRIWPRVYNTACRELRDSHQAYYLLEKSVCAASRAARQRGGDEYIKDVDRYLYLAFRRNLFREVKKENSIEIIYSEYLMEWSDNIDRWQYAQSLERGVLVGEVIGRMDTLTRNMFFLRVLGLSWDEIGHELGMTGNNACVQFNLGLKRTKKNLLKRRFLKE